MSKFNVGDKVRICRVNMDGQSQFIGEVHEVYNTDEIGVYLHDMDDDDDYWLDEEVELVRPNLYGEPVFKYIDNTMDTSKRISVESLYPYTIQPNFKLSEELQKEWDDIVKDTIDKKVTDAIDETKNWFKGKPIVGMDDDSVDAFRYYINELRAIDNFFENKEEKEMNKVVNLWYERKKDKIIEKYKELEVEFYNSKYSVVESFNELIEKFNDDLESLYKMDKATEQFVLKENTSNNVIKYCLDLDKLKEEFEVEYLLKRNDELKKLDDIKEEVEAQLSLSDNLNYQIDILSKYGILTKKDKKISG